MNIQKQLLQPQEIEVFYVIPTIRSYFAKYMKEQGKSQKEISQLLHIRESTVSNYVNSKRAAKIEFSENIRKEVKNSSERIKDKWDLLRETQRLLSLIRYSNELCSIHKKLANIPDGCTLEKTGCI
nr:helix-turn-helix domain-containing protein [Candidatus Woesearchaeota archaeon]